MKFKTEIVLEIIEKVTTLLVAFLGAYGLLRERILSVEIDVKHLKAKQRELENEQEKLNVKIEKQLELIQQGIFEINLKLERNNVR